MWQCLPKTRDIFPGSRGWDVCAVKFRSHGVHPFWRCEEIPKSKSIILSIQRSASMARVYILGCISHWLGGNKWKEQSKEWSHQKEHTETLGMIMCKPTTGSVYKSFHLFLCLIISAFPLCLLTFLRLSRCRTLWAMSYHGCILSVWSSLDPFSF